MTEKKKHSWIKKVVGVLIHNNYFSNKIECSDDAEISMVCKNHDDEEYNTEPIGIEKLAGLLEEPENHADALTEKKIQELESKNWELSTRVGLLKGKIRRMDECIEHMRRATKEMDDFKEKYPDIFKE